MLKIVLISMLLFTSEAFAKAMDLHCEVKMNWGVVLQKQVSLNEGDKNKLIGEFEEFTFYLTSKGENIVELQSYNSLDPNRSYATAVLSGENSFVDLAVWKREYLMEVRCTLI